MGPIPQATPQRSNGPDTAMDADANTHGLTETPLRKFFEAAVRFKASDLLLRGGQTPKLRVRGELRSLEADPIEAADLDRMLELCLSPDQWRQFQEIGSIDVGVDLNTTKHGSQRFRINIYRTRSRTALAARHVSSEILNFEQLHLPPIMGEIADGRAGMILLCGITGSGKSTTIASMLQLINETRNCHLVTIEDPIEYLFDDAKAVISQREIGIDVPDFPTGLRALVREDPDVVFIGEMRDKDTFEAAIQAAETGHLVFGTIHASSTAQAFGRIYDLFSPEEREGVRNMLAYHMRAIVYQKLVATISGDPPRVPAVEVLRNNPAVRKYILEDREGELLEVIKGSREEGMQTFVDSLVELVNQQMIHPRSAQAEAPSAEEVKMRLRGIESSEG